MFASRFPIDGVLPKDQKNSTSAVTGTLNLRYDVSDDHSLYGSLSRGYRPGGASISPGPTIEDLSTLGVLLFEEETSDSIELGFKSKLLGGQASLNGAVYYQQFDGYISRATNLQQVDGIANPAQDLSDIPGGLTFNGDGTILGL